jgi:hypothetical protein
MPAIEAGSLAWQWLADEAGNGDIWLYTWSGDELPLGRSFCMVFPVLDRHCGGMAWRVSEAGRLPVSRAVCGRHQEISENHPAADPP